MSALVEVASGLSFPEGPIAMSDGTVILVEMFGPRLTRVHPDGTKETIADDSRAAPTVPRWARTTRSSCATTGLDSPRPTSVA